MRKLSSGKIREMGARLQEARESAGFSREELCVKTSIKSENVLRLMEQGVYPPRDKQIAAIAKATGFTEAYLLLGEGPKTSATKTEDESSAADVKEGTPNEPNTDNKVPDKEDFIFQLDSAALVEARKKAGFSMNEAAKKIGVSSSTLYRCEKGEKKFLSGHTLNVLSSVYGVPVTGFVVGDGQKNPPLKSKKKSKRGKYVMRGGVKYVPLNKEVLTAARKKAGYSRTKVEKATGIPALTIKQWENGKSNPPLPRLKKLCRLYGITVKDLLAESKIEPSTTAIPKMEVPLPTDTPQENTDPGAALAETVVEAAAEEHPETVTEPGAATVEAEALEIPENPEEQFCKNILFYIRNTKCDEEEFDKAVGCSTDFFKEALQYKYRMSFAIALSAAQFFGKTLEEAVCDPVVARLESELERLQNRMREIETIYPYLKPEDIN